MSETSPPLTVGLELLDYLAIVAYLALTFGIAVWFGRRQKSVDDFFVGGRHMPWFAVGLSILATLFSTLSYLGLPGEAIKHGVGLFAGYLALPLTMSVIALLWIPFFMRLRLTSAYEYLERRFSYPVRLAGAGLFVLLRLGWMGMVIFAASMALDRVKGGDLAFLPGEDVYWWIGLIGLVAAIYTAVGGIQAMIWTDVLQCLLLLSGLLLAIGYVVAVDHTGPVDWWRTAQQYGAKHTAPPVFSFDVTVRVTIAFAMFNNFFWNICTHGSDQVVLQRYFSTASLKAARRSYFTNVLVDVSMATLLTLTGLALLAFYLRRVDLLPPDVPGAMAAADRLFPHFLGHQLPAGCAGLVMSAFLCDAIQTLESGVNAITAVATNDVVPRLRHGGQRLLSDLSVARWLTVIISLVVTFVAYLVTYITRQYELTLVDMMPKFFNMFVGPLAGMFILGMFSRRVTTRSVLPAVVVGTTVSFFWSWWQQLFATARSPSPLLAIGVPCLTTLLTGYLLSFLFDDGRPHAGWDFTWKAIVRRPLPENAASAGSSPSPEK